MNIICKLFGHKKAKYGWVVSDGSGKIPKIDKYCLRCGHEIDNNLKYLTIKEFLIVIFTLFVFIYPICMFLKMMFYAIK